MSDDARAPLRVVAGILRDAAGRVLLAQRPPFGELAGLWEFPGGKIEPDETPHDALARELLEELGVIVRSAHPFRTVHWVYHERAIELALWSIDAYDGDPHGREGQALRWVERRALLDAPMPAADRPIAVALNLGAACLVTPEPGADPDVFVEHIEHALDRGVSTIQLRARAMDATTLEPIAREVRRATAKRGATLILNTHVDLAIRLGCDGVHLPAARIAALAARPVPASMLLGASCHDAAECARARVIGADYLVIAPVARTASKPDVAPLGWATFESLARSTPLPCYALGGVGPDDLERARAAGAWGVAGISAWWRPRGAPPAG